MIGFVEGEEGRGGFARHLRGKDCVGQGSGSLKGAQRVAKDQVVTEKGAVMEAEEFRLTSKAVVFCVGERGREGKKSGVFRGDVLDDETDEPIRREQSNDALALFESK